MSIHKDRDGEFVAECTDCGARKFGGTESDFKRFVAELKVEGWRIQNNGGDWEHICPDCDPRESQA